MQPFLKWLGGKRWFVANYCRVFPQEYNAYFEPFMGGGSVFFYLMPQQATISDINVDLNPTKLSAVRSFYRMLLNPRKRLKTLGFKQVNNSFPFIRPHPLLRASRELAREKSREDIGF